jgi:hypothetical protein
MRMDRKRRGKPQTTHERRAQERIGESIRLADIPIRFENMDDMTNWFFVFTSLVLDITKVKVAGAQGAG